MADPKSDWAEEPQALFDSKMSEKAYQDQIVQLAKANNWLVYHTYDSRRSEPGFPDLIMVKGRRLIVIEVKQQDDKTPKDRMLRQLDWIEALDGTTVTAFVARPSDWERVEKELAE